MWYVGLAALTAVVSYTLIRARRMRQHRTFTIVAVERVKE